MWTKDILSEGPVPDRVLTFSGRIVSDSCYTRYGVLESYEITGSDNKAKRGKFSAERFRAARPIALAPILYISMCIVR